MATPRSFTLTDVNIARILLQIVIIVCIYLQPAQHAFMRRFIQGILVVFALETFVLMGYVYTLDILGDLRVAIIVWEVHKFIRLFVSLALCYPILVCVNSGTKLNRMLIVLGCIILSGTIVAYVKNDSGAPSPYNNIAFLVIFIFTLKQYRRLKTHFSRINSVEMNILNVLIVLETFFIVLDGFFILCFFQGVTSFLQCLRLAMTLIQLLKIYIVLSLFASLTIL